MSRKYQCPLAGKTLVTTHEHTRLRLGDVIELEPGKRCRVVFINACRAKVTPLYTEKVEIKGKFDEKARVAVVTPRSFDISPNTECKIVSRRKRGEEYATGEESKPEGV